MNGRRYSIIEVIIGLPRFISPAGICWIHSNANRKENMSQQEENFIQNKDFYLPIDFFAKSLLLDICNKTEEALFPKGRQILYAFFHLGFSDDMLKWIKSFYINRKGIFSKKTD